MVVPRLWLSTRLDLELAGGTNRVLLSNATAGSITNASDLALIIAAEPIESVGGYARQSFSYTPGSSTYNATASRQETPVSIATFTESGSGLGYQFTYGILWQGGTAAANKVISAIDTSTNHLTCAGHGLTDGDRIVVTSTGTMPGGVVSTTRYYANAVDANTFELHTNAGLSAIVDITSTGSGTIYLRYANGVAINAYQMPSQVTIATSQSQSLSVIHYAAA